LAISKDVQMMKRSSDKRSMRNPGARSSSSWEPPLSVPPADQLNAAAAVLNAGSRVAVLVGQGALSAREEVMQLSAANVAKLRHAHFQPPRAQPRSNVAINGVRKTV
jgi:thiamine pyrophosphate-dependent acetolactate synthase large subunit-like protein